MKLRNDEDLSRYVRTRRGELGWTQSLLAERAGVRRATVVDLERGMTHPSFSTAVAVLTAMDVSLVTRPAPPEVGPNDPVVPRRFRRPVNLEAVLAQARGNQ